MSDQCNVFVARIVYIEIQYTYDSESTTNYEQLQSKGKTMDTQETISYSLYTNIMNLVTGMVYIRYILLFHIYYYRNALH